MIKAILFDFGGVIYQHPKLVIPEVLAKVYHQPLEKTAEEYGNYSEDYQLGKISTEDLIRVLSFLFKSKKGNDEVKKLWIKHYGEMTNPNQEVIQIIKDLPKKYQVYLFSNTNDLSDAYNKTTGIYDIFDGLFFSFKMGLVKPDHKIYEKVLEVLNLRSDQCLVIDDSPDNIAMAKLLRFNTILFNVLTDSPSKLKKELGELLHG